MNENAPSAHTTWLIVVAFLVLGAAILWFAFSGGPAAVVTGPGSGESATSTGTAIASPPATASPAPAPAPAPTPAPVPVPAPAPAVVVTHESGESVCLVEDAFTKAGKDYVVVDYIQLGTDPHESEDYDIINENSKLRTFELTGVSWLGAFWMAQELYGDQVMDTWDYDSIPYGKGAALKRSDLMRAADAGTANDHSYWYIRVSNGAVLSLVNTYED